MSGGWQFWIDRGGTFTDVIALAPDGHLHVRKIPSLGGGAPDGSHTEAEARGAGGDPGIRGARAILESVGARSVTGVRVKVGTTVATNALLERKGEPVLLVTTRGFADALRIGYQSRPDIFARHIVLSDLLYRSVIEVDERVDATGEVLRPLDADALLEPLRRARADGLRAVAIVFMHGWRFPDHERAAAAVARTLGFEEVSVSHELSALVRFVARGDTTVLNAYLAPPLRRHVSGLECELRALDPTARLELMQSNGGLAAAARFHAMSSVLSGPAGGLIGMQWIGRRLSLPRLIAFDMGGTSTDVSLLDGELPRRFEQVIAGVRLQSPMLDVHTIAAGGGSILQVADGRFSAGPDSAGADPGPACYGRGGPPTLTDVQVVLGRLRADTLPHVFGARSDSPIDAGAASESFAALVRQVSGSERSDGVEAVAEAFLQVAVESMANAIRHVSTRQGVDAADFTLFSFGGAAGQYACRVAQAAGIGRILVHPLASVLSAFGIGVADRLAMRRASLRLGLDEDALAQASDRLEVLERQARAELSSVADAEGAMEIDRWLELRAGDSEATLSVRPGNPASVRAAFADQHRHRFGFDAPAGIVIEAVRAEARASSVDPGALRMPQALRENAAPRSARAWFGQWMDVSIIPASAVTDGLEGPLLIVEPHSTTVLERGWRVRRLEGGELLLEHRSPSNARSRREPPADHTLDPGRLTIFNNLYMHIAEQMGAVLQATAQSVNIKERLDYSCALFDATGGLVANAPHMPVHLGSMGASVRAVMRARSGRLGPDEAWLINSPYHGGTHLPDLTVVTPVFLSGAGEPDCFVASRAHHADIGGTTPGSMPPESRSIDEEGVLFECFPLVTQGSFNERELRRRLLEAPHPARNVPQNLADLHAQLAANARGTLELRRAASRHGLDALLEYMGRVQENAELCVRNVIDRLQPGSFRYEMDNGLVIAVRVDIERARRTACIDFSGTSPQDERNFNAPRAVCIAAVLYVFRTLVDRQIPLNEGCLAPLRIVIPRGSLLDPLPPAAVAAGNVETSQCIVDALYGALGALAASQGTMNNLTFGNEQLQYYETIAGGAGAGAGFAGCDAVQTHMTNSRLTDPEILEGRFPVLLREFAIRRGSGGSGRYRGGDGVIRRLAFSAPLCGALLANHRRIAPFGLEGASAGAVGTGHIRRASGALEPLGATARFEVTAGDELTILTPGGGGFGPASD